MRPRPLRCRMARQDWWLLAAADQRLVRRAQVAVRG